MRVFKLGVEQSAPFLTKINQDFNQGGGSMVVRINNNLWRVQFTYPQNPNLRMSDGRQVLGLCDNNIKTIFIADNQSDCKTEHIICHEVTHAICMEYNITIPYGLEEELCNFMADYGKEIIYIVEDIISAITKKRVV